nr:DUF2461 domain-containing protein [uncultured Fluviicola sp.]
MIQQSTLEFLSSLKVNNDRDWFQTNKAVYEKAHQNTISFADSLLNKMRIHDSIETQSGKASLFRIYADTRFSKDKAPYKTHFGIRFSRATAQLRGGYYFHLEPGNSFMAGGFFSPNPDDLKRIREDIAFNYEEWNEILTQPELVDIFGKLRGEGVKTAPKGFDKDHPAIELLRKKQFILRHDFTDKEVLQADFPEKLNQTFQALRPFLDYMSEVLTTDANGETIV